MNSDQLLLMIPNQSIEERLYLQSLLASKTEEEKSKFLTQYILYRKDPNQILIFTIMGFFCIAGIQRLFLDDIFMGIIYFCTLGFCGVGTIIDAIRYKELTFTYNQKMANLVNHGFSK